ncbi:MAG: hypothetical protein DMG70_19710, partial [Acidobacteria bacterium]
MFHYGVCVVAIISILRGLIRFPPITTAYPLGFILALLRGLTDSLCGWFTSHEQPVEEGKHHSSNEDEG